MASTKRTPRRARDRAAVIDRSMPRYTATVAKNKFADILEQAIQGRDVVITRHNAPKAVVISVERFETLSKASTPDLAALSAEFDARLARMQTPKQRQAMDRAFASSPVELGRVALKAARAR